MLVTVDPGVNHLAVALFSNLGNELMRAQLLSCAKPTPWSLASLLAEQISQGDWVTIELPQVYQTAQMRGAQSDLIDLALVVGACGYVAADCTGRPPPLIRPAEWKGQTPKNVSRLRVEETLTAEEKRAIVWPSQSLRHNVYDAIHMGLWLLKRVPKR